jgi:uncharacterized MAPEG superfamily protein
MTIAYFCVLIASILPIVWVGYAKIVSGFTMKDNFTPRELLEKCTGKARRAKWAQENSWEAFAPFAAAVIIAAQCGVLQSTLDSIAMVFVAMRILFGIFYIADQASLRSLVWFAGMGCNFTLYYLAWAVS